MKKKYWMQAAILLCAAVLFFGCSSSDSDEVVKRNNNNGPAGDLLAGFVEDGPIEGARVFLYSRTTGEIVNMCGAGFDGPCEGETGADGGFTFRLLPGANTDDLEIVALGGTDTETGVDFGGMELRAPVEMFDDNAVCVTPMSTLISLKLEAGGGTLQNSNARMAEWLGVPEAQLTDRPADNPALLQRTLFLTQIILSKLSDGADDPFGDLLTNGLDGANNLFNQDGSLDAAGLGDVATAQEANMATYFYNIMKGEADMAEAFKELEMAMAITRAILELQDAGEAFADFDLDHADVATYRANALILAQAMITAAGDQGIPLDGMVPMLIARYVIDTWGLDEMADFLVTEAEFRAKINGVDKEEKIAEIADTATQFNVEVALAANQLPGDDNQARLEYYYGSNVSHLYKAEQVVRHARDDEVNDQVLYDVLKGTADAGLFDIAENIVKTKIWQSEYRGDGWRSLGLRQAAYGRLGDAVDSMEEAEYYYRRVINAKGEASIGNSDTTNLQGLSSGYRQAGDMQAAQDVLDYMESIAHNYSTTSTWGRLVIGARWVADDYIEIGDMLNAEPVVDSMYHYAQQTPSQTSSGKEYFKSKIFNLKEAAKYYSYLGVADKVLEIHNMIAGIRADDGLAENLTGANTWFYIPDIVLALYVTGHDAEAQALAQSIPATYVDYKGRTKSAVTYQQKAYKYIATYKALNESIEAAMLVVNNDVEEGRDRMEALTYYASNDGVPYVAMACINGGLDDRAKIALDAAAPMIAALNETTDSNRARYVVERGYAKVANLYRMIGENALATGLLETAKTWAEANITGAEYLIDAYCHLANVYYLMGDTDTADDLMALALGVADDNAAAVGPADAAQLYKDVIAQMLAMEDRDGAVPVIESMIVQAQAIFNDATPEDDHDDAIEDEVDYLIDASEFLVQTGEFEAAGLILQNALATAKLFYNVTDKYAAIEDIVEAYANAGDLDTALEIANSIPFFSDRNDALLIIAETMARADAFPDTDVASVDTDGDGDPNFFHPLATAQEIADSGLTLDNDSDGDGKADVNDNRPLFVD